MEGLGGGLMRNVLLRACCSAFVTLSLAASCYDVQAQNVVGVERVRKERPVLKVDNKHYFLKDLLGFTEAEYRAEVRRRCKRLNDDELKAAILRLGHHKARQAIEAAEDRDELEQVAIEITLQRAVERSIAFPIAANIMRKIFSRHGTSLEEYCDVDAIRKLAMKRPNVKKRILEMHEKGVSYDEIAATVNKEFEVQKNLEFTAQTVRYSIEDKGISPAGITEFLFENGQLKEEWACSAILSDVLRGTYDDDSYYCTLAAAETIRSMSMLRRLQIHQYSGSVEPLNEIAKNIVNDQGMMARAGASTVERWLSQFDLGAYATGEDVFSGDVLERGRNDLHAVVGKVERNTHESYSIFGLKKIWSVDNEAYRSVHKGAAASLALADYYPEVVVWLPEQHSLSDRIVPITTLFMLQGPFRPGRLLKKPYPAEYFDDWKRNQGKMQTFLMRAALVSIQKDAEAADALMGELAEAEKNAATQVTARTYRKIHEELKKEFE